MLRVSVIVAPVTGTVFMKFVTLLTTLPTFGLYCMVHPMCYSFLHFLVLMTNLMPSMHIQAKILVFCMHLLQLSNFGLKHTIACFCRYEPT